MRYERFDRLGLTTRTQRVGVRWCAALALVLAAVPFLASRAAAQGYGGRLTMHGLHQQVNQSAASRAFGGVTVMERTDGGGTIGLMFQNPAAMRMAEGLQFSVAAAGWQQDLEQIQQYAPVRYYPNLSLLLENRTAGIPAPDPDLVGFTPADSVQRPYDDIQPHWSNTMSAARPLHALISVPFSIGSIRFTAGAGAIQKASLDHYYQNNNVLEPAVLVTRPLPTIRPTDDNPVTSDWYQSSRSREGTLRGYGAALAGHIEPYNVTLGVAGARLIGSSEDVERRLDRGTLTFLANEFRADSSGGTVVHRGTSDFSATALTFGALLESRYVNVGFSAKAPTTYERTYTSHVEADTAGTSVSTQRAGEDRMRLPWTGSVGLLLKPRETFRIGLEYELRPYASAVYTDHDGRESSLWHSSRLARIGAEYVPTPWVILRVGIRGESDVFVPDGHALAGDPVAYRVYTAGFGLRFGGIEWNVAYENANMEYQDIWASAVSRNQSLRHTLIMDIAVTLPIGS